MLSSEQEQAVSRLSSLLHARSHANEANLPVRLVPRWSALLLLGPSGIGKTFVCEELARRWPHRPFRRWDIGGWIARSHHASVKTLDQLEHFVRDHPQGSIIYLARLDAVATPDRWGALYQQTVANELCQFLDLVSQRHTRLPGRSEPVPTPPVFVVIGARFDSLWRGHRAPAEFGAADDWKYGTGDEQPLDPATAATWLAARSGLTSEILRRLVSEPLLLPPPTEEQARQLAIQFHDLMPPSLDGILVEELTAALCRPQGWREVAKLVEGAFAAGYEDSPASTPAGHFAMKHLLPQVRSPRTRSSKKNLLSRSAHQQRLPAETSALQTKIKRLGCDSPAALDALASARGYVLPGERITPTLPIPELRREEFGDMELMLSLLSPYTEYHDRAVCRGALMLRTILVLLGAESIMQRACSEHAELVVRHIALLGYGVEPQFIGWRDVLVLLPLVHADSPGYADGALPDGEILAMFGTFSAIQNETSC